MERLFNLSMVWYKITLLNGSLKLKSLSLVLLVLLVKVSPFTHPLTHTLSLAGRVTKPYFLLPHQFGDRGHKLLAHSSSTSAYTLWLYLLFGTVGDATLVVHQLEVLFRQRRLFSFHRRPLLRLHDDWLLLAHANQLGVSPTFETTLFLAGTSHSLHLANQVESFSLVECPRPRSYEILSGLLRRIDGATGSSCAECKF